MDKYHWINTGCHGGCRISHSMVIDAVGACFRVPVTGVEGIKHDLTDTVIRDVFFFNETKRLGMTWEKDITIS
jgi:hypothetical protein